jgi:hypothetical protein
MSLSHSHPQAINPNELGNFPALAMVPFIDPSTPKYQELFKSAIKDAMKALGITGDICRDFTPMGPNLITRYFQYRIFRDAKETLHTNHIDDDHVFGNTRVTIANYVPRWGTVPPHWDVTYVLPSDSDSSSEDDSAEESDDEEPSAFRPVPARIARKLSFDELFDTSDEDEDDEDVEDYVEDDVEELPDGMYEAEGIVYMSPDMCPPMGNPLAGGYEPPPFDEDEEAFVAVAAGSEIPREPSALAPASRKRKRALVPTRYSKRLAARARKKRRFFGQ